MKILIALMGLIAATGAFADSVSGVAERVTCADIQAVINELSAVEEPDEETLAELDKQKMEYRRKCSRSAAKRKSSAVKNTVVAPTEMIEVDTIVLENGIEYTEVDNLVYNDTKYILLTNAKNVKDSCIRKLEILDNEEYLSRLDNDSEFDAILDMFLEKNKTLFN